jgi:hypothetical protein
VDSLRARVALVLLNLTLLGGVVWLGRHALRPAPEPVEFEGSRPVAYALDGGAVRGERGDLPTTIGQELDRPLPPAPAPPSGPPPPPPAALGAGYRLLLVSEDRDDPRRSTAIVGATAGTQRTVMIGEELDGFEIIHIGLEGEGDATRGVLTGERDGRREDLRTERSTRL